MKRFLQILFIIALLWFVISRIELSALISYYNLQYFWGLLVCELLLLASILVAGFRFKFFIQSNLRYSTAMNAMVLMHGYTNLLPGRLGEFVRIAYVHRHANVNLIDGLTTAFVERCLDVYLLLSIACGILLLNLQAQQQWTNYLVLALGMIPLGYIGFKSLLVYLLKRQEQGQGNSLLQKWLMAFHHRTGGLTLFNGFVLGCVTFFLAACASICFLMIASTHPFEWSQVLMIYLVMTVGAAIPILPGGLGTMEGGAVLILEHYGVSFNEALALTLGVRLCMMVMSVPWTVVLTLKYGTGLQAVIKQTWQLSNECIAAVFKKKRVSEDISKLA